eukprot:m.22646 g.22646  ORF g.22646 m.22646 type:complete len:305 (+) comp5471_c0_seq2:108-1022(+)
MSETTIAIITGNSNTGLSVIPILKAKYPQFHIRAMVRKKASTTELEDMDCEVITADIKQKHLLDPVFEGVTRAYFAVPATKDRVQLTKYFVDACFDHGVQYATIISIIGADMKETTYQKQFNEIEEYVQSKAGQPVTLKVKDKGKVKFIPTIVRCAPFYQNFYGSLSSILRGQLYLPLLDCNMCHVDIEDVAECIVETLANPEKHGNKTYTLLGEYQPGNMIASTIGMRAGVHCTYENVDGSVMVEALQALDMQPWIAEGNTEMIEWFKTPQSQNFTGDIEEMLGRSPTKFGKFVARDFKPMLE